MINFRRNVRSFLGLEQQAVIRFQVYIHASRVWHLLRHRPFHNKLAIQKIGCSGEHPTLLRSVSLIVCRQYEQNRKISVYKSRLQLLEQSTVSPEQYLVSYAHFFGQPRNLLLVLVLQVVQIVPAAI